MAHAALSLAYPLLDIVLVSMVLVLHFRRSEAQRSAINIAIGALALTVLCDALFTSPLLREHYASGQLLDAGWFAGSLLLAYAAWVGRGEIGSAQGARGSGRPRPDALGRAGAERRRRRSGGRMGEEPAPPGRPIAGSLAALTPYLAAAVCTLGILYNVGGGPRDRPRRALHGLHGRARPRRPAGHHAAGQHQSDAGTGPEGEPLPLPGPGLQRRHHDRLSHRASLRYVSPAAAGVYGRDADALIGSELAALIHPEDLAGCCTSCAASSRRLPQQEPSTRIECRFRHGGGHWLNVESTVNRYRSGLIFNSRDVTERVRLQAQLQHNASHDPLTDLPNRALFTERVRKALAGRRGGDSEHAVLFIDLDGFKAVNDTVGHQAGDELLVAAARRLQESVRAGDTAARLGGDEFAVLILGDGNPSTHADAERELRIHEIADRLRMTLSEPYRVEGSEVRVAASIGIAFAEPGISPTSLMRNADLAMYRAKQAGKARVELYAPQMQTDAQPSRPRPSDAKVRPGPARRAAPCETPCRRASSRCSTSPSSSSPAARSPRSRAAALALRAGHPLHPRGVPARRRAPRPDSGRTAPRSPREDAGRTRRDEPPAAGGGREAGGSPAAAPDTPRPSPYGFRRGVSRTAP